MNNLLTKNYLTASQILDIKVRVSSEINVIFGVERAALVEV